MNTLVIYTGGTIGMVPSPDGLVPQKGVVETCLQELSAAGKIPAAFDVVNADPLIDSSAITPEGWNWIGAQIETAYEAYDAFVVIHGTDTMTYSACALSFGLKGLSKPVILTGSMLPLGAENTDGLGNLSDAMNAAHTAPAGVWVQFAGRLIHGTRARKSHSQAPDAFHGDMVEAAPRRPADLFEWKPFDSFHVPVITVAPSMDLGLLDYCAQNADGIVLRCYGAGTLPVMPGLAEVLQVAQNRGVPIIAVSQCARGGVALGTYAAGQQLLSNGIVDGQGSTTTAAYVKALYTLSNRADIPDIAEFLATPLCGELG